MPLRKPRSKDYILLMKTYLKSWYLDLLSTASVKSFAARAVDLERLDSVVGNAGMTATKWIVAEGIESTIMTNLIGTELLALLLLPKLQDTANQWGIAATLSFVVSESHFVTKFEERNESDILGALHRQKAADVDHR